VHRPSAINPSEYRFVGFEHTPPTGDVLGDAMANLAERERIRADMKHTGGTYSRHEHGGNCMVCGAHAIYTALFHHKPTNTYVRMGQDCAQKCEMTYDEKEFNAFRKNLADERLARAGKAKAKALLSDHGVEAAWDVYDAGQQPQIPNMVTHDKGITWVRNPAYRPVPYEEATIRDMVGKLIKYGSLSDKQYNFIQNLLTKITNRAQIQAQRKTEHEQAAPLPAAGRQNIVGTVLSTKHVETDFGPATKMLVRSDAGWKVWGTVPSSVDVESIRGKRVSFAGTIQPSRDDPKFGFFSRPAKFKVLEPVETDKKTEVTVYEWRQLF
jgi:hypothetical protein